MYPVFSGKFTSEDWKNNPTFTPKSSQYYEVRRSHIQEHVIVFAQVYANHFIGEPIMA